MVNSERDMNCSGQASVVEKALATLSPSARPHCSEHTRMRGIFIDICVLEMTSMMESRAKDAWDLVCILVIK